MERSVILVAGALFAAIFAAVLFWPDLKPFRAPVKTDADLAYEAGTLTDQETQSMRAWRKDGVHMTLAELRRIENDVDPGGAYARVVELAAPQSETFNPRDADSRPHRLRCHSIHDREGRNFHVMVFYNDDYYYDVGDEGLYNWVRSGCAAAMQDSHETMSEVTMYQRLRKLMPKTPDYEMQSMSYGVNIEQACMDDVRTRMHSRPDTPRTDEERNRAEWACIHLREAS